MTDSGRKDMERNERIVRLIGGGIWTLDPNDRIDFVNQAGAALLGYEPDEMFGRMATDFKLPELGNVGEKKVEGQRQSNTEKTEFRMRRKDGSTAWVIYVSSPFFDDDGRYEGTVAMFTDITDHEELEASLRKSIEEREDSFRTLDAIFKYAPAGITITGGPPDYPIRYVSDYTVRKTGRPREKLLGVPAGKHQEAWGIRLPDETVPKPEDMPLYRAVRFGEEVGSSDFLMRTADGRTISILEGAAPILGEGGDIMAGINSWRDISEIRAAQKALEEGRSLLQTVIDHMPLGVAVVDASGKMIIANDALGRVYRRPQLQASGNTEYMKWKTYHPERMSELRPEVHPMAKALRSGEVVRGDEVVIRRGDGSYATLSSSVAPIKDAQGLVIAGVAVVSDITERKRAEEAVERSNVELQQFAYVASHDLQEPLRMIISFLGLLNKKYGNELNDQAREYMAYVLDGAARMRELINDLLQYSRIDTQGRPLLEVNLDLVADKVIDTMQDAITEGKATVTKEPLPDVWGDPTQLSLLLQSLIGNALKFRGPEAPNIDIFSKRADGEWIIGVKDNGIGIDPKYKDKLFLMFQRLHSRQEYEGTGIGLAIAKKIVERHGGRIWVESDGKTGSTFLFTLPKTSGK